MLEQQQTISFSDYSSLYDLIIPKDNLLRQITDLVDFSFVYQELQDKYCHDNGRTAESPIRMFKYLLLKVIYDISDVDVVEHRYLRGVLAFQINDLCLVFLLHLAELLGVAVLHSLHFLMKFVNVLLSVCHKLAQLSVVLLHLFQFSTAQKRTNLRHKGCLGFRLGCL